VPLDMPLAAAANIQPKSFRPVYFRELDAYHDTPVFERHTLRAGFSRQGPLLVEDEGSTLVVGPQGHVRQLTSGNLIINIGE